MVAKWRLVFRDGRVQVRANQIETPVLFCMQTGSGAVRPASHIALMSEARRQACPICGKPVVAESRPFCSRRCAEVDLNRWLSGVYAVPVTEDEEEDERRDESGPP
jgi:uncharacterized protein